jgi:hypothetical protein
MAMGISSCDSDSKCNSKEGSGPPSAEANAGEEKAASPTSKQHDKQEGEQQQQEKRQQPHSPQLREKKSYATAAATSPLPTVVVPSEYPTISFMDFQVGNIGLFFPVNKERDVWMAFNSNKPHYFVAKESLPTFINKENSASRMRILGKIFFIEICIATKQQNPYNVPIGAQYHSCHCEKVFWQKK